MAANSSSANSAVSRWCSTFGPTWCQPCQRELPALQQAAAHFGDRVVFAGVDQGETAEVVQSYVDKLGLTFTIPMDGSGDVGYQYNVKGLPTTFFIGC